MKVKILILSLIATLTACSGEHEDLQSWMQETRLTARSKIRPVEAPKPLDVVSYSTPSIKGPHAFSPKKMRSASQSTNAPDLSRPKELLENYSLEKLKFVGSIGASNNLVGLISIIDGSGEAAGRHVYTVKPGNYMGQNYGEIKKITSDGIELVEIVEDTQNNGNWITRTTFISIDGPSELKKSQ